MRSPTLATLVLVTGLILGTAAGVQAAGPCCDPAKPGSESGAPGKSCCPPKDSTRPALDSKDGQKPTGKDPSVPGAPAEKPVDPRAIRELLNKPVTGSTDLSDCCEP
jgi:hypothetical protein